MPNTSGAWKPFSQNDTYPTGDGNYNALGLHVVTSVADMLLIPLGRRIGVYDDKTANAAPKPTACLVREDDTVTLYWLKNEPGTDATELSDWEVFAAGNSDGFQGFFNPNTTTLVNGTGTKGDYYFADTAGNFNGQDFSIGDKTVYDGSVWGFVPTGTGASDWNSITGKPTAFTPVAHTHPISQVTGLQTALDNKLALDQIASTPTSDSKVLNIGGLYANFYTKTQVDSFISAIATYGIKYAYDTPTQLATNPGEKVGDLALRRDERKVYKWSGTAWVFFFSLDVSEAVLTTPAALRTLRDNSALVPNTRYEFDFQTIHNIQTSGVPLHTGKVERLGLIAQSAGLFFPYAYSVEFPNDIIKLDLDDTETFTGAPREGWITYREDIVLKNSAVVDFRNYVVRLPKVEAPAYVSATAYPYGTVRTYASKLWIAGADLDDTVDVPGVADEKLWRQLKAGADDNIYAADINLTGIPIYGITYSTTKWRDYYLFNANGAYYKDSDDVLGGSDYSDFEGTNNTIQNPFKNVICAADSGSDFFNINIGLNQAAINIFGYACTGFNFPAYSTGVLLLNGSEACTVTGEINNTFFIGYQYGHLLNSVSKSVFLDTSYIETYGDVKGHFFASDVVKLKVTNTYVGATLPVIYIPTLHGKDISYNVTDAEWQYIGDDHKVYNLNGDIVWESDNSVYNLVSPTTITVGSLPSGSDITGLTWQQIIQWITTGNSSTIISPVSGLTATPLSDTEIELNWTN